MAYTSECSRLRYSLSNVTALPYPQIAVHCILYKGRTAELGKHNWLTAVLVTVCKRALVVVVVRTLHALVNRIKSSSKRLRLLTVMVNCNDVGYCVSPTVDLLCSLIDIVNKVLLHLVG